MAISSIGFSIGASNARFSQMQGAEALMKLSSSVNANSNPRALLLKEQQISSKMLSDSLNATLLEKMAEQQKKLQQDKIKRTFSTFA